VTWGAVGGRSGEGRPRFWWGVPWDQGSGSTSPDRMAVRCNLRKRRSPAMGAFDPPTCGASGSRGRCRADDARWRLHVYLPTHADRMWCSPYVSETVVTYVYRG
jgi:hypothetical protein